MSQITIEKADCKKRMRDFVKLPRRIYRGCRQYVPDLESDIRDTFDPRKNAGLEYSDIQPFVAYDGQGECVGRVAAIVNRRANERWQVRCVRFGLIEFVDDREVSAALLSAVEQWGHERGMTAMQGPMGILDFDKEGMLVEDFDLEGAMTSIYNPPYYPQHLEALGFEKEVDWVQIHIDIPQTVPAKYARVADYVKREYGLRVVKMTNKAIYKHGFGRKVFDLLNVCYAPLFGFTALTDRQVDDFLAHYLPLIDYRMMPVVVDADERVVGIAVTMGSLAKALRKAGGRMLPLGWFHIFKALKLKHEPLAEMMLVAVHPDYQGLGVNALFFDDLIPVYNALGYTEAETAPQLEDNMRELTQWKLLHPRMVKRRRCYRKQITV